MSSYTPPTDDIHFMMTHVADLQGILATERFGHVDMESIGAGLLPPSSIPFCNATQCVGANIGRGRHAQSGQRTEAASAAESFCFTAPFAVLLLATTAFAVLSFFALVSVLLLFGDLQARLG